MQEFFQTVDNNIWGDGTYRWLFLAGILVILIFEKRREVKLVFALYSIVFTVFIFNPLAYRAVVAFWGKTASEYFSRLFEMVPVIYCIAQGMMLMIRKGRTEWLKAGLALAFALLIFCTGTYSYGMPWVRYAENIQKVPAGLTEICEKVHSDDKDICIAVPDTLSPYVRQVDASLYTPYGRMVTALGEALSETKDPDVDFIMRNAGQEDCDYVVAINNDGIETAYREAGYSPYMKTDDYLVYEVTGVPRKERQFNDRRQIAALTNYDEKGTQIPFEDGYYTVCYEYDRAGNTCREYYLDDKGKAYTLPQGYAMTEYTYYPISGLVKTGRFEDSNGDPVETDKGYSEIRYEYKGKKLIKKTYYDMEGTVTEEEQVKS